MNERGVSAMAERKALLRARAELDRTRLAFALAEIRAVVAPPHDPKRAAGLRPTATMILSFVAPIFGGRRVARWLRYVSFGLTALRIARNWRQSR